MYRNTVENPHKNVKEQIHHGCKQHGRPAGRFTAEEAVGMTVLDWSALCGLVPSWRTARFVRSIPPCKQLVNNGTFVNSGTGQMVSGVAMDCEAAEGSLSFQTEYY